MHKVEKELVELTGLTKEEGESYQEYAARLAVAVEKRPMSDWDKLSPSVQRWVNAAGDIAERNEEGKKKKKELIPEFDAELPETEEKSVTDEDTEVTEATEATETVKPKAKKKKAAAEPAKEKPAKAAKAAKEKPAKATKAKANGKSEGAVKRGRKGAFGEDDKITKVAAENPFRDGSKAAKCFKEYKVGRTVKQVLAAGVPRSKLKRHSDKGHVTIG